VGKRKNRGHKKRAIASIPIVAIILLHFGRGRKSNPASLFSSPSWPPRAGRAQKAVSYSVGERANLATFRSNRSPSGTPGPFTGISCWVIGVPFINPASLGGHKMIGLMRVGVFLDDILLMYHSIIPKVSVSLWDCAWRGRVRGSGLECPEAQPQPKPQPLRHSDTQQTPRGYRGGLARI
jgi:hypothetical protein